MDTVITVIVLLLIVPTFLVIGVMIIGKIAEVGYHGAKKVSKNSKEPLQKIKNVLFKPNTFCSAWTLEDFSNLYGQHAKILSHFNRTTQKVFHTCEIYNDEGKTYSLRFSASLGELSLQELKDRKSKLYVGKTNNGRYYLYDEYYKEWETIDLNFD